MPAQTPSSGTPSHQAFAIPSPGISGHVSGGSMGSSPVAQLGTPLEQFFDGRSPGSSGHGVQQVFQAFAAVVPPVVENVVAAQRDTNVTWLVDVDFEVHEPEALDQVAITGEYSLDGGAVFLPATPQPFDSQHTVGGLLGGLPTAPPGAPHRFVWQAFQDLPEGTFSVLFKIIATDLSSNIGEAVSSEITVTTVAPETTDDLFTRQLNRRAQLARTPDDFLGNGILIPLRRGARDFVTGRGVDLVRSAVRQILGTRATVGDNIGELEWRSNFGCKIWILRHAAINPFNRARAEQFVREALSNEPRVRVSGVVVEDGPNEPNRLQVRVIYQVISENVEANRVSLPEFSETVSLS